MSGGVLIKVLQTSVLQVWVVQFHRSCHKLFRIFYKGKQKSDLEKTLYSLGMALCNLYTGRCLTDSAFLVAVL